MSRRIKRTFDKRERKRVVVLSLKMIRKENDLMTERISESLPFKIKADAIKTGIQACPKMGVGRYVGWSVPS